MLEVIKNKSEIISIIIRKKYKRKKSTFITPGNLDFQIGYLKKKQNTFISTHYHLEQNKNIKTTFEVLFIKKGKIKVSIYNLKRKFICNKMLKSGDIIMLGKCAHGFKVINDCDMIEIKQGPFRINNKKIIL